ncbi:MAG: DUF2986 domain-containing protein [Pseudomonadota bacterium]|jgi:hypothetical protein|uniref:DUF2986 domain-containing protein n=1 Tax=Pseudoalteromonas phenolica TaxID=161398 RepID=UPI0031487C2F|tara:strand:+ start:372 stop:539 length:168 start_codon:yes stop_codon:yes gene_type:complete
MNRRKKIYEKLKKKDKKANEKLHKSNKPKYISKAERAKLEAEQQAQTDGSTEVCD